MITMVMRTRDLCWLDLPLAPGGPSQGWTSGVPKRNRNVSNFLREEKKNSRPGTRPVWKRKREHRTNRMAGSESGKDPAWIENWLLSASTRGGGCGSIVGIVGMVVVSDGNENGWVATAGWRWCPTCQMVTVGLCHLPAHPWRLWDAGLRRWLIYDNWISKTRDALLLP